MIILLAILLFIPSNVNSDITKKVCITNIIKNYEDLEENLKICDPGNRVLLNFNYSLSPEYLITNLCDLRFSVIFDFKKETFNTKNVSNAISCIYLPKN